MAVVKKTKIRAQTQLNNATDVAGSDGHMILADGSVKMNSEYAIADRKAIAHSGFVATRLAALLGVSDSLTATISWSAAEAPLIQGASSFKAALTTLANELDDQGLGTTSLQDEVDETQAGAGLSALGAYVAVGARNYIGAATSLDNADHLLDAALKAEVDARTSEMAAHEAAMASSGSLSGSYLVGYSGQAGANGDFSISAKRLDQAIDDIVVAIDADREEFDVFESDVLSQVAGKGSAKVGYSGEDNSAGNNKFSVVAGTVEASLDAIVDAIDLDRFDLESRAATKGAAKIGYDGKSGANGDFSLVASQVDAALDSVVDAIDADREEFDVYEADILSQAAAKGAAKVGYDGQAGANLLFSLAASQVDVALDSLVTGLDAEKKATDDHIAALANSNTGGGMVGYAGHTSTNGLFSVAAGTIEASLDSVVGGLDAEKKATDDHIAALAAQATGAGMVGFKAHTGTAAASTDSRAHYAIAGGTAQAAFESIINQIDLISSDDNVAGSVEYKIDQALTLAIGGGTEMAATLSELSSSLAALNEGSQSSLEASISNMILNAKEDIRAGVDASLDTFNEVAARIEASPASALDTAAATLIEAINENHAELDATQVGAGLQANGSYLAVGGRHYIGAATDLDDADEKLSAALKVEELARIAGDAGIQSELDATQAGAGLSAAGAYVAVGARNYIGAATSLDDADSKLDAALKLSMDNLGIGASGLITWAGTERYVADVNMKDAMVELDSAIDAIETAVIDLKAGNAAFVRKGDHVVEEFDATAAQTLFTISAQAHQESVMVFVNGMLQRMGATFDWEFGVTDDKIELKQASELGDYVVIKYVKKTSA